jgi:predicted CXXCH cytochrome family protein
MPHARRASNQQRLIVSLATALAGGLLAGQSVESRPPEDQQRVQTTSQPSLPTTAPAFEPLGLARSRLLSGLVGSKHDFTRLGQGGRDLCLPCHTPHQVTTPAPRLDRRAGIEQPLQPFQTLNLEISGWSLLCLGCHDGITASDVYSSPHAINVAGQLGDRRLNTRGLRSHPIGTPYPLAAETYDAPAAVEAAGLPLDNGRIQCTTCHDAHNTQNFGHMLRMSNEGSRLCLTCHRL